MAADAANALLHLATPPRTSVSATSKSTTTTPERTLKICGLKRTTTEQHDITYETEDGKTCRIPFYVHEDDDSFVVRRTKAAKAMYDPLRADVYCTWNGKIVNIPVEDTRYTQFHDSPQQKRFVLNNVLQLVYCRYTCVQWGGKEASHCRICNNRGFRSSCQIPRFLYYMMPLPAYKAYPRMCDYALAEMEPIDIPKDTQPWNDHTPQNYIR